jgi:hypothetical protein
LMYRFVTVKALSPLVAETRRMACAADEAKDWRS